MPFTVRKVELSHESEGPDYFTIGEFQVVDDVTGRVVARFPWSLEEAYLTNANYSGPDSVRISEDGTEAIAREGQTEVRVLLPVPWVRIDVTGIAITPATDFRRLAPEVARSGGPGGIPAGQWLWMLFQRLGVTAEAAALGRAIERMLDSEHPAERAGALRFYSYAPNAPGYSTLLRLAATKRMLFPTTQPGSWGPASTLDDDLIWAVVAGLQEPGLIREELRDVARAEATRPGGRDRLLISLLRRDRDWVDAQFEAIARAQPFRWSELLYAFSVAADDHVGQAARRIVERGIAPREDVLAYARDRFFDYSRGEVTRALATGPPGFVQRRE